MLFEWDDVKSNKNKEKHGIDFESAKDLWLDEHRIEIVAPYPIEDRWILIAKIKSKHWTAIYTIRDVTIRIISVRRARRKEVELYEKQREGKKYK